MHTESTTQEAPSPAGWREWVGLAVLMLPVLLISMDVTVLNFALPWLSADLVPSGTQLLWIMDIYTFLLAGLLITMGTLGDRIGRRRLLLLGAVAFGGASVMAAFAQSAEMLIAARAVLGIGGATLMPSTLALIRDMFRVAAQRRLAIALWTAGFTAGTALGPLVGGALLEFFWWGSVFLINVPVMVLLLVAGPLFLPESRKDSPGRFDLFSAALSLTAVLAAVYGLKRLVDDGVETVPLVALVGGLVLGVWFVLRQRRLPDPLIDVRLFAVPALSVSLLTLVLGMFSLLGFMFFVAQYLQLVVEMRPFVAGLWTLPVAIGATVGAVLCSTLVAVVRPAYVVACALVVGASSMLVLRSVTPDFSAATMLVGMAGVGLFVGGIAALCTDLVVAAAPPERAGAASSLSEAAGELGGALGVAVLGSVGMAVYRSSVEDNTPDDAPDEVTEVVKETLPGTVAIAEELPAHAAEALRGVAFHAFTDGIQWAVTVSAVTLAVTAVMVLVALRRVPPGGSEGH
ncbi:MFS transporter [Spiractinospora alimapuensis]|uniref:MFS transporter n=1 Tax=Spiractinospora alimapuensis TaxID=2820884 RepID=UPI001F1B9AF3|nr:MFS transporter [Spiractinospora alimapuensis]QVQ51474.1 MFS transporter [Spiractinospora alimapuensis]